VIRGSPVSASKLPAANRREGIASRSSMAATSARRGLPAQDGELALELREPGRRVVLGQRHCRAIRDLVDLDVLEIDVGQARFRHGFDLNRDASLYALCPADPRCSAQTALSTK